MSPYMKLIINYEEIQLETEYQQFNYRINLSYTNTPTSLYMLDYFERLESEQ